MLPLARPRGWGRRVLLGTTCLLLLAWAGLTGVRALFPLAYREEILAWSEIYHLEAAWVASVIRNESRFEVDAVSSAGAVGLMQVMPETATWIAQQMQWAAFSTDLLCDAPSNIALGTWYLRHLLDRFPTPDVALMAYNAGPTLAEQWGGELDQAYPETQRYVRRVRLSLPVYRAYFAIPWLLDLIPSLHLSH
jgi:soluble lytic murein transglycosylase